MTSVERRDRQATVGVLVAFAFALGAGTVILPLLALESGYAPSAVGFLTAASAITQLGLRPALPRLLSTFPDRALVATACALMASSYLVVLASTVLPCFLAAQVLQGAARSLFWAPTQTHAVRSGGGAVRRLAQVTLAGNVGNMTGPAVAGALAAVSLDVPLGAACAAALVGSLLALRLRRLEPYERHERRGDARLWRSPRVRLACSGSFAAGGWRALLGSYVPVVLSLAQLAPRTIGLLVALADAAGMVASMLLVRLPERFAVHVLAVGVAAAATALAVLPLVAGSTPAAAAVLAVGGAGGVALTTLAPALASESVAPADQGAAIVLSGTFRAVAVLALPVGVGVTLGALTISGSMLLAGAALGLPILAVRANHRLAPGNKPC